MRLFDRNVREEADEIEATIHPEPEVAPGPYLDGNWVSGQASVTCERPECMVNGMWWTEDLPWHASWQDARTAIERHEEQHNVPSMR